MEFVNVEQLPPLITLNKNSEDTILSPNGKIIADYNPSLGHSELFCDITGDENPIHKEQTDPAYIKTNGDGKKVIMPGLLQMAVTRALINKIYKNLNINLLDNRFVHSTFEFGDSPVVSGLDYKIEAIPYITDGDIWGHAAIFQGSQNKLFELNTKFSATDHLLTHIPLLFQKDLVHLTHVDDIPFYNKGKHIEQFSKLVGSQDPLRNLYTLCCSSSVICDSIHDEELPSLEGKIALYSGKQEVFSDINLGLNLSKGFYLSLYINKKERFGEIQSGKDAKPLNLRICGRTHNGDIFYASKNSLTFQREGLARLLVKQAYKKHEMLKEQAA